MLVRMPTNIRKQELLKKGIEKHAAYDRNFRPYENHALLYLDGTEVLTLPGQQFARCPALNETPVYLRLF